MPAAARYFLYLLMATGGFALGRFAVPGTSKFADPAQTEAWEVEASQRFWAARAMPLLEPDLQAAAKLDLGRVLLDHCRVEDFPAVNDALGKDEGLRHLISEAWARADAPGFFKYHAGKSSGSPADLQAAGQLLVQWSERDLSSAEAAASRLRVPGHEPDPLKAVAVAKLRKDVGRGLDFLNKQHLALPDAVMVAELQASQQKSPRWKGADENARLELIQSQPASAWRETLLQELYQARLSKDPQGILVEAQESGRGMNLVAAASLKWLESDPAAAAAFFEHQARHQVRSLLGAAMVAQMAATDPDAAWEFAQMWLAGRTRADALEMITNQAAAADPAASAARLADANSGPWRIRALAALHDVWKAKDALAAERWWSSLPASDRAALKLAQSKESL